jgi:hypothetical protein
MGDATVTLTGAAGQIGYALGSGCCSLVPHRHDGPYSRLPPIPEGLRFGRLESRPPSQSGSVAGRWPGLEASVRQLS